MKIASTFISIVICCFLSGCGGPVYEKKLNGNYYLDAVDEDEDMAIGIQVDEQGVGVIGATVFAVGQNDNFIVAKQHPRNPPGVIDKSTTNYFIIPLQLKVSKSTDRNYFGPLQLEQFEKKKRELGIGDLEFTIVFNELE
ncbi:DUF3997 domain-containing protein [Spirosoma sp. HMF3257]|uniref:DUF3997 domain-containing protein n=1 Tax=Spirosoma telluris TaxID=2183553 RepID=A0A327NSY1_9BACT|nr:DUF3997 domain-containing protein [Spirosoma telluris]RAI77683.1 hypothetical protein HMF3257_32480 [Spirosoma telluris]